MSEVKDEYRKVNLRADYDDEQRPSEVCFTSRYSPPAGYSLEPGEFFQRVKGQPVAQGQGEFLAVVCEDIDGFEQSLVAAFVACGSSTDLRLKREKLGEVLERYNLVDDWILDLCEYVHFWWLGCKDQPLATGFRRLGNRMPVAKMIEAMKGTTEIDFEDECDAQICDTHEAVTLFEEDLRIRFEDSWEAFLESRATARARLLARFAVELEWNLDQIERTLMRRNEDSVQRTSGRNTSNNSESTKDNVAASFKHLAYKQCTSGRITWQDVEDHFRDETESRFCDEDWKEINKKADTVAKIIGLTVRASKKWHALVRARKSHLQEAR